MRGNRGISGLAIGLAVFVFVILTAAAIVVFFVAKHKGFNGEPADPPRYMQLLLRGAEAETNHPIPAHFIVEVNKSIISQGTFQVGSNGQAIMTPVVIPEQSVPIVYCWSDTHYLTKAVKVPTPEDRAANVSTMSCDMVRIGNVSIRNDATFDGQLSGIRLNITSDAWLYRAGICFAWSAGIISVTAPQQLAHCSGGWKNYSAFNKSTLTYDWLQPNVWACGDQSEKCSSVESNSTICRLMNDDIPDRLRGKVDSCMYLGKTLNKESLILPIQIKTIDLKNSLDYVQVIIYDKDRRYNPSTGDLDWIFEANEQDVGAPDVNLTIWYREGLHG